MAGDATGEEMDVDKIEGTDGSAKEVAGDEEEMETDAERCKGQKNEEDKEGDEEGNVEENLRTSVTSLVDRPMRGSLRERKTVEKPVEVCKPATVFVVEQGRGVPLKEIQSVALKLSKKRPEVLKLLHQTLFGVKQGKVSDFKKHILQFSGFVWHEEEEKERTKVKENLSYCTKDMLVELCVLFDLPGSKAKRKEELVATILEFLEEPRSATDTSTSGKKSRGRKRMRGGVSAAKSLSDKPLKGPKKKLALEATIEAKDKEEADGDQQKDTAKHSECEIKHTQSEDVDNNDGQLPMEEANFKPCERIDASDVEKIDGGATPTKMPVPRNEQPLVTPSAKKPSTAEDSGASEKVSRKKNVSGPRKEATLKMDCKEKSAGTQSSKGNAKPGRWRQKPTRDELRQAVCTILDTANFVMMTFGDVVKEVDKYFGKDLSAKKPLIKSLIEEELFRLAEEAERKELEEEEAAEAKARVEEAAKERPRDERIETDKDAEDQMAETQKDTTDELEAGEDSEVEEDVRNGDGKAEEAAENRNGNGGIEGPRDDEADEAEKYRNSNNYIEGTKDAKAEETDKNGNADDGAEGAPDGKAEQTDRNDNGKDGVQDAKDGKEKEVTENVNTERTLAEAGHNSNTRGSKSRKAEVGTDAAKDDQPVMADKNGEVKIM